MKTDKRNLINIMNELAQHTELRAVTPLIIEYQQMMGVHQQNHNYVIGLMTAKYTNQYTRTKYDKEVEHIKNTIWSHERD